MSSPPMRAVINAGAALVLVAALVVGVLVARLVQIWNAGG